MIWRLLFIAAFIPLGLPWVVCAFVQLAGSGLLWLVAGPDEDRTLRLVEAAPAAWFHRPLDYLADRAGVDL